MEMGEYAKLPANERTNGRAQREPPHPGQNTSRASKTYIFAAVSFGLLFIVQSALNVSFWLQTAECSTQSNNASTNHFTKMSAVDIEALILEKDRLVQENDQLVQEKKQLVQEKDQLVQENDQLVQAKTQLVQEKDLLVQEKDQMIQDTKQLVQEKDQLVQKKDQLVQDTKQLVQEKDQLVQDKKQLVEENKQLVEEKDQLIQEKKRLVQEKDQLVQEKKQLVQEKDQLVQDTKQLVEEKDQLVQEKDQLVQDNKQLVQEKDQLVEEKDQLVQDKKQLVQEKDQLVQENNQLVQENNQLVQEKDQLVQEKKQLVPEKDQLVQEKKQLVQEKDQLVQDKKQLVQEKNQLVQDKMQQVQDKKILFQDKKQLVQERDQLVHDKNQLWRERNQLCHEKEQLIQERDKLVKENKEQMANNTNLFNDNTRLGQMVTELQNQIQSGQNIPCCPSGWQRHESTCYQLSSRENTWQHAKEDCESKGSHLVLLNDEAEEKVVRGFGGDAKLWMGLSGYLNREATHWYFTTVDSSPRCYQNWKVIPSLGNNTYCAYVDYDPSYLKTWFLVSCQEQHKWMCEKKPASICQQNIPCCPSGWQSHKSTCYQLSSSENTWQHAKEDCESKGSHLVVLNNEAEEKDVRGFGGDAKLWMGLTGNPNRQTNSWELKTVDSIGLCYGNWNDPTPKVASNIYCAYVDNHTLSLKKWFLVSCQEQHKWMCEKKHVSILRK